MKQVYPISIEGGPSRTGSYILMLEEPLSGRQIPIVIGEHEAHGILIAKGMVPTGRPMTHRLMSDLMASYGISLVSASIDRVADGIFYATIHTTDGFNNKDIDSRTTDAVTIALLRRMRHRRHSGTESARDTNHRKPRARTASLRGERRI